jgi:hypothetical protein
MAACPAAAPGVPLPTDIPVCCKFCNCIYHSTYDPGTSAWSNPTLIVRTTGLTSQASVWGYDPANPPCGATTTVTSVGACG